jgi:arylsulfatase A-like enzyme
MGLTEREDPRFILDRTKEVRQAQDHPVYAGMMEAMDEGVGLVLEALDQHGLADNTIVIFTSDNGGVSSGDGFATSCLPLRGGKGRQWEGGVRQPLYIYWPGVTRGTTTDIPATGTDFYPTLLDIAGLPAMPKQHVDGVSLVNVLRGGKIAERSLFWHYPHYGNQGGEPSAMIRKGEWKLINYFEDDRSELYHVNRDLGERENLSNQEKERTATMLKELKQWQKEVGARSPIPNPNWNSAAYEKQMEALNKSGIPRRNAQHSEILNADYSPRGGWWQDRKRQQAAKKKK